MWFYADNKNTQAPRSPVMGTTAPKLNITPAGKISIVSPGKGTTKKMIPTPTPSKCPTCPKCPTMPACPKCPTMPMSPRPMPTIPPKMTPTPKWIPGKTSPPMTPKWITPKPMTPKCRSPANKWGGKSSPKNKWGGKWSPKNKGGGKWSPKLRPSSIGLPFKGRSPCSRRKRYGGGSPWWAVQKKHHHRGGGRSPCGSSKPHLPCGMQTSWHMNRSPCKQTWQNQSKMTGIMPPSPCSGRSTCGIVAPRWKSQYVPQSASPCFVKTTSCGTKTRCGTC